MDIEIIDQYRRSQFVFLSMVYILICIHKLFCNMSEFINLIICAQHQHQQRIGIFKSTTLSLHKVLTHWANGICHHRCESTSILKLQQNRTWYLLRIWLLFSLKSRHLTFIQCVLAKNISSNSWKYYIYIEIYFWCQLLIFYVRYEFSSHSNS